VPAPKHGSSLGNTPRAATDRVAFEGLPLDPEVVPLLRAQGIDALYPPQAVLPGTPGASWGGSSSVAPPANFGFITSTRASMRQIQLALKYNF